MIVNLKWVTYPVFKFDFSQEFVEIANYMREMVVQNLSNAGRPLGWPSTRTNQAARLHNYISGELSETSGLDYAEVSISKPGVRLHHFGGVIPQTPARLRGMFYHLRQQGWTGVTIPTARKGMFVHPPRPYMNLTAEGVSWIQKLFLNSWIKVLPVEYLTKRGYADVPGGIRFMPPS